MPVDFSPFRVAVPPADLDDLEHRLRHTRWPSPSPAPGWEQGIPLPVIRELCDYWATGYDWRATEARLNAIPQYLATVDGLRIHVLHAPSDRPGAFPLVLTHGWPGSVLELAGLVPLLTEKGFDVVIPSLPGYGFSDPPTTPGWGVSRIAGAWAQIMAGLGYTRYGAAGSDWGTSVSSALGEIDAAHVAGIHLVPPLAGPDPAQGDLTPAEEASLARMRSRGAGESAYSEVHRTRPQTLGYALDDSPAGLCAWMAEKLITWAGVPLSADQILDQVSLYWLTGSATSAARLYAESITEVAGRIDGTTPGGRVNVPVGASLFAAELPHPSRRWAARRYRDIRLWIEHDRGGHFPALEVPGLLADDLAAFFRITGSLPS